MLLLITYVLLLITFSYVDSLNSKIIQIFNKVKITLSDFYLHILKILRKVFRFKNVQNGKGRQQTDLDKKLVFSLSKSRIPSIKQIKYIKRFLSSREVWLIIFCSLIILISSAFWSIRFYKSNLHVVPIRGGEYTEGLIGMPKYINPLYANISDVDNDLANLIFSSIFKRDKNGELVNDLAESYEINQDNKSYTIKIKQDVSWHNNSKLTVDDIIFTFNCIKDKQYQSPWRAGFTGVKIEKIDEQTIKFILTEPYAAFLDLLTFGILPQELWQQISAETANLAGLNLRPIGSGPYKATKLLKDEKAGNIRSYTLMRNDNYYGQKPFIDKITFKFFPGFEEAAAALNHGLIDGISYLPRQMKNQIVARDTLNYYQLNLPQLTAIFLNQKANSAVRDKKIRHALVLAIDKNKIISEIMGNEARLIDSPILPDSFAYNPEVKKYKYNIGEAVKLLDQAGWKITELTEDDISQAEQDVSSEDAEEEIKKQAEIKLAMGAGKWRSKDNEFLIIKLTTVDNEENAQIAQAIAEFWQGINIRTEVELVPANQMQSEIIKPRNFTALLYGEVVGADPDPYPFWHSSQIGANGLNITDYANKDVDALLEDARLTSDTEARKEKYKKFQEIIAEEIPAIFLYSPTYTYVQSKKVKGFDVRNILIPRDRFVNVNEWYVKTGKKLIYK